MQKNQIALWAVLTLVTVQVILLLGMPLLGAVVYKNYSHTSALVLAAVAEYLAWLGYGIYYSRRRRDWSPVVGIGCVFALEVAWFLLVSTVGQQFRY